MAARLAGKVPSATSQHRLLQALHHHHYLTTWSMTKDSSLESALSRNRRWIVNNQIKQILLRSPARVSTVRSLQKRFQTLDLQGRALNWLNKYPCCFTVFTESSSGDLVFGFSKRMSALIEEEESVMQAQEPAMARRLAKLLMLSCDHRLNVVKLNELKRSFGFPDDYLLRILPKHPNTFRIRNPIGRRNSMEIQLLRWQPELAVSAVEAAAMERGTEARFECALPLSWIKTREKFQEFNDRTPYVSPYAGDRLDMKSDEKRAVGIVHELLSLTLWKKMSIVKLEHFRKEFRLPEDLRGMLLRHPCLFYVSNRYKIYTLVLREGYKGSELVEKDPLVMVKDKFGELMQEGLHEYNRRRHLVNLEKKRKKGEIFVKEKKVEEKEEEVDSVEKREERKRFYKVLFDENP